MNDNFDLIRSAAEGNREAFSRLYAMYRSKVFRVSLGMLHIKSDAEDITQEVFTELWKSASKFRGEAELSTWLYRIAVNKSLNFIRKNKRIELREDDKLPDSISRPFEPETERKDRIAAEILHRAVDSLPENQKTVFVLNKYEKMPAREIAEVLNVKQAAVDSLIYRAKLNLQKSLVDFYKKNYNTGE